MADFDCGGEGGDLWGLETTFVLDSMGVASGAQWWPGKVFEALESPRPTVDLRR